MVAAIHAKILSVIVHNVILLLLQTLKLLVLLAKIITIRPALVLAYLVDQAVSNARQKQQEQEQFVQLV